MAMIGSSSMISTSAWRLPLDLGQRVGDQLLHLVRLLVEEIGGVLRGEALHRRQQQRLARQRRHAGEPRAGDGLRIIARSSGGTGPVSTLAEVQIAWKTR